MGRKNFKKAQRLPLSALDKALDDLDQNIVSADFLSSPALLDALVVFLYLWAYLAATHDDSQKDQDFSPEACCCIDSTGNLFICS